MDQFWAAFVPQLLASVAGAAVGIAGVWLAFRLQLNAAARNDFRSAAEGALAALTSLALAADSADDARDSNFRRELFATDNAIRLLVLKAGKDDYVRAQVLRGAWNDVAERVWRSGRRPPLGPFTTFIEVWLLEGKNANTRGILSDLSDATTQWGPLGSGDTRPGR